MKIFSKFHDYYDTAIGYGIDPNVVYSRKTTEHSLESAVGKVIINRLYPDKDPFERIIIPPFNSWYGHSNIYISNTIIVIFCGSIYVGLEFTRRYNNDLTPWDKEICYKVDQVERFFIKHGNKLPPKTKDKRSWRKKYHIDKTNLTNYWQRFNQKQNSNLIEVHFEIDSPITAILNNPDLKQDTTIIVNPCLKEFQFYKCMDSFTTFQELSMFIGGVMGGKIPAMLEISDADRLAMHGFDKWSFRKLPEKK